MKKYLIKIRYKKGNDREISEHEVFADSSIDAFHRAQCFLDEKDFDTMNVYVKQILK